jgi:uncharacterized membrane protein YoaK (UPF0700 family)
MSSANESSSAPGGATPPPSGAADAAMNGIAASGVPGVAAAQATPGAAAVHAAANGTAPGPAAAGKAAIATDAAPGAVPRGPLLSFLAGYADTVGFVGLGGLFTAHVTGNFVLLGYALVAPVQGILPKFLAFPVFVLWIALTRLLVARWQQRNQAALAKAMTMQALLLVAAAACAWLGGPIGKPDAPMALACGMLCVAAMAAQNAYGKLLLPQMPATTVMTGNVTQLVIALMDARKAGRPPAAGAALGGVAGGVLGFAAGACCGALMARWSLPLALLAACLLLAPLAWQARRQS